MCPFEIDKNTIKKLTNKKKKLLKLFIFVKEI